jgi:hypothetical protein
LFTWSYALFHGEVINNASQAEMLTPHVKRKDGFMGYGIFIGETPNHNKIFYHDGEINGYQAFLIYVPDKDIMLIMLSCVRNWKCRDLLYEIVDEVIRVNE